MKILAREDSSGGGGNQGGAGGGADPGGAKPPAAGCYLNLKSEQPWSAEIFPIKDALHDLAVAENVLPQGSKCPGYIVKDRKDATVLSIKFDSPATA